MTPLRWAKVKEIFLEAAGLRDSDRNAYVQAACAGDSDLLRSVVALLSQHETTGTADLLAPPPRTGLSAGTTLNGRFRIKRFAGAGGMGEVYEAEDLELGGSVALKTLRSNLLEDQQFLGRFRREVQLARRVTHPNICRIFDAGNDHGRVYLTMEFLDGESLADHLRREAPLTARAAMPLVRQIADGLTALHAQEIVHRDLKPGNILLVSSSSSGATRAVITDFGLARAAAASAGETSLSVTGHVLGTPDYMSPEQLRGETVTAASDTYAFGLILYEMVTGKKAYPGGQAIENAVQRVLEPPKPLRSHVPHLPAEWETVILRCLEREPSRRPSGALEVVAALEGSVPPSPPAAGAAARARRRSLLTLPRLALLAGLVGMASAGAWWIATRAPKPPDLPSLARITSDAGLATDPTLSTDGRVVVYASDRASDNLDIWLQQLNGGAAIRLTSDPADERSPSISPDGGTVAFRSERDGGGIYLVSTLGGSARFLAAAGRDPRYSPQGDRIAFWVGEEQNFGSRLFLTPAAGGEARQIPLDFQIARSPIWSPDGTKLMFYGAAKGLWDWYILPATGDAPPKATGAMKAFTPYRLDRFTTGEAPVLPAYWDSAGDVLFAARLGDSTGLWKIAVPHQTGQATGAPQRLTLGAGNDVAPSATPDGRVVYSSQVSSTRVVGLPADPNAAMVTGKPARLTQETVVEHYPHISLDGTRLVWESSRLDQRDIWTKNLATGQTNALINSPAPESSPRISRDGSEVAYSVTRREMLPAEHLVSDIFAMPTGGGGTVRLCQNCGRPTHWSRDNRFLLFDSAAPPPFGISLLEVATGNRTLLLRRSNDVYSARFSPDDAWIAFHAQTSATGRRIYAAPFHGAREIPESDWVPITSGGQADREPYWSPDGKTIYFLSDRDGFRCIWAQAVDAVTRRPTGAPKAIYHFHTARSSLTNVNWATGLVGFSVAKDKFVFSLGEITGDVWMLDPSRR